jgi:hypothetical protein
VGGPGRQINTLTAARSVTARAFTGDEQAQNHVRAGNIALPVQVMLDWLDSTDRHDSQPGLMS